MDFSEQERRTGGLICRYEEGTEYGVKPTSQNRGLGGFCLAVQKPLFFFYPGPQDFYRLSIV